MKKTEALKVLNDALGIPKDGVKQFEPVLFLRQVQKLFLAQHDQFSEALRESLVAAKEERASAVKAANDTAATLQQLAEVMAHVQKALEAHRVERVEVERVIKTQPIVAKVEVPPENPNVTAEKRGWFMKMADTLVKAPINTIQEFLEDTFEGMRTNPKFAIGVRLVDKGGEKFYNALLTSVSAGVSQGVSASIDVSALAQETTLQDALTSLQIIDNFISGSRGLVTEDNSAAIKTALETIDNIVSGAGVNVSQLGGASVPIGPGVEATALRVTLPTDGTGLTNVKQAVAADLNMTEASAAAIKTAVETIDNFISGSRGLVTEDNSGAIKTAVEMIDNFISGARGLVTEDNSAAIAASLAVMDDWDESDRAKANIIVGQAGITAGAGAVAANTPRVTHASDDPVTTALQIIDNFISGSRGLVTEDNSNAIKTAVEIMDDWDESDRVKTNPIVGQAGVAAGAGAVSATVQRVVLATDTTVPNVTGNVAHDATDSGNPVKIGFKAVDLGATPTAVAANERTDGYALRNGIQFVLGGHPNTISKAFQVTDADGAQTNADLLGAISASTAVVVTKCSVTADAANTNASVAVRIGFGASAVPAVDSAGIILQHDGIPPGGGVVEGNGAGIIGIGASGEELRITCDDPTGGSINVIVTYFTIAIG